MHDDSSWFFKQFLSSSSILKLCNINYLNHGFGLWGIFLSIPLKIRPSLSYIGSFDISAIKFSPLFPKTSTKFPSSNISKSNLAIQTPHSKYGDQVDEVIVPTFLLLTDMF